MKFRKKPVVVEAKKFTGENGQEIADFMGCQFPALEHGDLIIGTLEGNHRAKPGDWIIKGVQGEFYPCNPDIFQQTYEPIEAHFEPNETEDEGMNDTVDSAVMLCAPSPCKTCSDRDKPENEDPCAMCGPPAWKYHDCRCDVVPRYTYRLAPRNDKKCRTYEIGECDNPRSTDMWCDRRVCEGFWGNEALCRQFVDAMNDMQRKRDRE